MDRFPVCSGRYAAVIVAAFFLIFIANLSSAQDASTGAIRGRVADTTGAVIPEALVVVTNLGTDINWYVLTDAQGDFVIQMLPPGQYRVRATFSGLETIIKTEVKVEIGGSAQLEFLLGPERATQTVEVASAPTAVETTPSEVSSVIDERAINDLPLNGRRFSDLALLTPGVTQDPRGLTSASNGDLSFGGIRGYQSSYLVDGVDNNNGFFAQARGRYRAPYQFSNEVVQEFRVSSNTYGVELGRSGGAVINVVTKSGTNHWHGTSFYYLRDGQINANYRMLDFKPVDRQHQFGGTVGGPIAKNRVFVFAGFDQHIFHVPTVVHFLNGTSAVTPAATDYESTDQNQVFAAANQLSGMGGEFRSQLLGNTGFIKLDAALSPKHYLATRLSTSRYYGANNVFFDPASPITNYSTSENGEERVSTESAMASLTSSLSMHATSHLRMQLSRDLQESTPNSSDVQTRIDDVIEGFGRSTILPRRTREHRLQIAETLSVEKGRNSLKFGGDITQTWIYNYFPADFGGEYIFDNIRVSPWTFDPMTYGIHITPLRAYAHGVPRYYIQDFGDATSRPDTREYSGFVQDTVRVARHLALSFGMRYDLQTFNTAGLQTNPDWPQAGRLPVDTNNFSPRVGFAWSIGDNNPLVVRGGYGLFYTRIPQIYNSTVELDNGLKQTHLFLDNADYYQHQVFPTYPNPMAVCGAGVSSCLPPDSTAGYLTSEIAAFSPAFQTPYVQQASLSLEREVARRLAIGVSYLFVHGEHLIRARDVNLPAPTVVDYPVFDEGGTFTGDFYPVASFSNWQFTRTLTCPFPPCLNPLQRPIDGVGAINEFDSAASSVYHGMTVSIRRRMTNGFYFRLAYTWARAIDDGQDSLVVGRPALVENSYAPYLERGPSVTDQRHRIVASWIWEPRMFDHAHPVLSRLFNHWKLSNVFTGGSGRPVNARVAGDANGDDNSSNDRLPGVARNSYYGPDYMTSDVRLARKLSLTERVRMELQAEMFNTFNRANLRVDVSDDGFLNTAATFVPIDTKVNANYYPGYYTSSSTFLVPNSAYAPRQIQFAIKLIF